MSLCSSRRVQSPPLQCTETLSTRKCFRCLWVFFVGNFGLKILGQGCITAQHFTLQYLGARTWGSSSILWVAWIVISNVCHGLRRGSEELGATGVVPARVEVPPHSLFSACLCLLCPQTIFAYFAHKQSPLWSSTRQAMENKTFKQTPVKHLEKKKKPLNNCLKIDI